MAISSLQEIVCCVGQTVAGNPAQYVMEKAFRVANLDTRFLTLEVALGDLPDAIRGMRAMGFRGASLLPPYTVTAADHLDELSKVAEIVGEVNFIRRHDRRLIGDHLVGQAVLRSLKQVIDPASKDVVVLGAGSAATAVAVELGLAGASAIKIVNRTAERGQQLATLLSQNLGITTTFLQWVADVEPDEHTAVVIQAAAIESASAVDRVPLNLGSLDSSCVLVDMRFSSGPTQLIHDASADQLRTIDGVQIQVNQAAIAFQAWTGVEPDETVMRDALEEFLMI